MQHPQGQPRTGQPPRQGTINPNIQCYNCGELGHINRYCPYQQNQQPQALLPTPPRPQNQGPPRRQPQWQQGVNQNWGHNQNWGYILPRWQFYTKIGGTTKTGETTKIGATTKTGETIKDGETNNATNMEETKSVHKICKDRIDTGSNTKETNKKCYQVEAGTHRT